MNNRSTELVIYKNLLKYIDIIGYEPVEEKEFDKKDLIKTLQFYSYLHIKAVDKKENPLHVFLISDPAIVSKSKEFKKILRLVPEKKAEVVIVSGTGLKSTVRKMIKGYDDKDLVIRDLLFDHFKFDLRNNVMVPKHEICTPEETARVLEDNKIDFSDLPKIKHTDPQILWIGGLPGQLVKVYRRDVTGTVLYYRFVV